MKKTLEVTFVFCTLVLITILPAFAQQDVVPDSMHSVADSLALDGGLPTVRNLPAPGDSVNLPSPGNLPGLPNPGNLPLPNPGNLLPGGGSLPGLPAGGSLPGLPGPGTIPGIGQVPGMGGQIPGLDSLPQLPGMPTFGPNGGSQPIPGGGDLGQMFNGTPENFPDPNHKQCSHGKHNHQHLSTEQINNIQNVGNYAQHSGGGAEAPGMNTAFVNGAMGNMSGNMGGGVMAAGAPSMGFQGGQGGFPGGQSGFPGAQFAQNGFAGGPQGGFPGAPNGFPGQNNGLPGANNLMASMPGGMPPGMGATGGGIEVPSRPLSAYEQQEAALRESEEVQQLEALKSQREADETFRNLGSGGGGNGLPGGFPGMGGEVGGSGIRAAVGKMGKGLQAVTRMAMPAAGAVGGIFLMRSILGGGSSYMMPMAAPGGGTMFLPFGR